VTATATGPYMIEFNDGTMLQIFPAKLLVEGTLVGDRTYAIIGKYYVIDRKNDLIAYIESNPDDRWGFSKMLSKKKTFPDYFQ
jgi:hypothetical protein